MRPLSASEICKKKGLADRAKPLQSVPFWLVNRRSRRRRSLRWPRSHFQREARKRRTEREIEGLFGRTNVVDLNAFQSLREVFRHVQLILGRQDHFANPGSLR